MCCADVALKKRTVGRFDAAGNWHFENVVAAAAAAGCQSNCCSSRVCNAVECIVRLGRAARLSALKDARRLCGILGGGMVGNVWVVWSGVRSYCRRSVGCRSSKFFAKCGVWLVSGCGLLSAGECASASACLMTSRGRRVHHVNAASSTSAAINVGHHPFAVAFPSSRCCCFIDCGIDFCCTA